MAGRGCYLVEEKFLTPALMSPVTKVPSKSMSLTDAENGDSGLRDMSPPSSLDSSLNSGLRWCLQQTESDTLAPGTPSALPGSSDSVRNAEDQETGQEDQHEPNMDHLVPDTRVKMPAQGDLHLPKEGPGLGVSVKAEFATSVPTMLQNVTVS